MSNFFKLFTGAVAVAVAGSGIFITIASIIGYFLNIGFLFRDVFDLLVRHHVFTNNEIMMSVVSAIGAIFGPLGAVVGYLRLFM